MNNDILKLLTDRYFIKGETTWEQLAERVGALYEPITEHIKNMEFVPSSPTLMNANTKGERKGTLSSCFPMNIDDSMEEIMEAMKESALVTKSCGGVGYNWTKLRGKNEGVKGTGKNSGGVMSFIGIYDAVLEGVRQGVRRGAGMSLLSIYHPQILEFIDAKKDLKSYNRSNFSVTIDSEFYNILEKEPDKIFQTINIVDKNKNNLIDDNGTIYTYKMLWDKIITNAHLMAEPGIINEDYIKERSTLQHIDLQALTNPCSEFVSTVPYNSCNLGSIDVSKFVKNDSIDWDSLKKLIRLATRFLNKVIDNNNYPLDKIKDVTLKNRPCGLGLMGFAHLLYKLNIPYDSKESKELAEKIMKTFTLISMDESCELAKENQRSFEWYDYKIFMKANKRLFNDCDNYIDALPSKIKKYGCYNSSQTSIAPTGSISTIVEASSGIEPVFGLVYIRKVETGSKTYTEMYVIDKVFQDYIESYHKDDKDEIYKYVATNKGSCRGCKQLSEKEQKIFVTAGDISPEWHLEILEPFANFVSLSVSKTINLAKTATKEDVSKVYIEAFKKGIIGNTVYRDGSREGILVHTNNEDKKENDLVDRKDAPKRPIDLECDMHLITVKGVKIAVLVGKLKGLLYEIFVASVNEEQRKILEEHKVGIIKKVKTNHYRLLHNDEVLIDNLGKFGTTVERSLARLISMSLRHGVPLKFITEQLNKSDDFASFDKSVSRVLKQYIKDGEEYSGEVCPECKSKLVYHDGCIKCSSCFYSKCG